MAILLVGPSSSGKTTFFQQHIKKINKNAILLWGNDVKKDKIEDKYTYIHYNLLRRYTYMQSPCIDSVFYDKNFDLRQENIFYHIFTKHDISKAYIFVTPLEELKSRIKHRKIIETDEPYDSDLWLNIVEKADIFYMYELLFIFLENNNIDYEVLYSKNCKSSHDKFIKIDRVFIHKALYGEEFSQPSVESVKDILSSPFLEYQDVNLPYKMSTTSKYDHLLWRKHFSALFPGSMVNKSVLDIGCAIGGLLLSAERLGSQYNVGIELNKNRYMGAQLLKKVLQSSNLYINGNFNTISFDNKFDYVFCLNVIHHIEDIYSFLKKACNLTNLCFIIEYPLLSDRKFSDFHNIPQHIVDILLNEPLLGVSSLKFDQTYVFTRRAMDEIILNKIGGFKNYLHVESSIPNRALTMYFK